MLQRLLRQGRRGICRSGHVGRLESARHFVVQHSDCTSKYASLLQECADAKALAEGKRLHAEIIRNGYDQDTFVGNHIVQMYGKCGSLEDAAAAFCRINEKNVFSWNIMIVACVENRQLQEARSMFEQMPDQNVVAWTTMITAYAKYGHLQEAREMFDNMPRKNEVSWAAMMSAYTQNDQDREALHIFRLMDLEGAKPHELIFVIVLDACRSLSEGMSLHSRIMSSQFHEEVKIGNVLINMYGKFGSHENARSMFDKMSQRGVVTWNLMISAYAKNGHPEQAFKLFREMGQEGVKPGKVTFLNILEACGSARALGQGKFVHAIILDSGIELDVVLGTAVVTMYGKCGSMQDGRNMFDKMPHRSVVSWTAMITSCAQAENPKLAMSFFREMHLEGVMLNEITFVSILDACSNPSALSEGKAVHACVAITPFQTEVKVGNALISMYGKCGSLRDARRAFDEMLERDVVSWTAMIAAYAHNEYGKDALELFRRMDLEGVKPVEYTFVSLLEACANLADMKDGKIIHACIVECGVESDPVLGNALVNMFGKCGSLQDAKMIFDKLQYKTVVSWTTMITIYSENEEFEKAIETFALMDLESMKPNEITFMSVIDACAGLTALATGKLIHTDILLDYRLGSVVVGNALMNMYAKCGSLVLARTVFDKMLHRDVVSWNSMVAAHSHVGHGQETLDLFHEMNLEGMKPTEVTFISVLCVCNHAGLANNGFTWFASIYHDYGILPTLDHYMCMIDLLGRGGRLNDAEELINSMPFEPDLLSWSTLLSACRLHGDVKRGERYAEQLLQLNPDKTAVYVLLSNIYSAAQKQAELPSALSSQGMG